MYAALLNGLERGGVRSCRGRVGPGDDDEMLGVREDYAWCRHVWPEWTEDFLEEWNLKIPGRATGPPKVKERWNYMFTLVVY